MNDLAEWDSFYLIVGSAAGALIGLQFVVMTLIAASPRRPAIELGDAFATPNIVHFSVAFLLAAIVRVPWHTLWPAAALWGIIGLIGVAYSAVVTMRMRSQDTYKPVFEDWLFHSILPLVAYAVLAISALAAISFPRADLFAVGGSTLLLLFIGIHNSWDTVTYNVFADAGQIEEPSPHVEAPDDSNESETT